MRHGRAKAARKTLQFFERTRDFKPPYHVLLDGTFCVAAANVNIPVWERLQRLLQVKGGDENSLRLYVCKSSLEEMEVLGKQANNEKKESIQSALVWARENCTVLDQFPEPERENQLPKAYHKQLSTPAQELFRLATLETYFLCSQDEVLLDLCRTRGVPCIRLSRTVLLLEHASKAANKLAAKQERQKVRSVTESEKQLVDVIQQELKSKQQQQPLTQQRMVKKAKGPNPLSCKKKRSAVPDAPSRSAQRKKKRKQNDGGEA
jgi:U3 small nucleolar RNA-associated protein 23